MIVFADVDSMLYIPERLEKREREVFRTKSKEQEIFLSRMWMMINKSVQWEGFRKERKSEVFWGDETDGHICFRCLRKKRQRR